MNGTAKTTFKEKIISFLKRKKFKLIISAIVLIALIVCGLFLYAKINSILNPEPNTDVMITTLQEKSDLITGELKFWGMTTYKDSGVALLNKSDYDMFYQATALVGIDIKEVKIKSDDLAREIIVSIPPAKALYVKVNYDTIKFYNVKFSLFNTNEKEDQNKALQLAEEEALKEVNRMGALELADKQAESLIKGLLSNLVPRGYTIRTEQGSLK